MKLNYKHSIFIVFALLAFTGTTFSQGIYFDPSPTDVTVPARLYVDISSADCACPELQDADPVTNPLYIWAWDPFEDRESINGFINGEPTPGINVKNGEWGSSNENLKMKQDSDNPSLWYFDFLGVSMVEFYQQPAAVFYSAGIKFLLKEKNGAGDPEQKSPDLSIIPEPIGCFEKVCPFPTTFFQDEYFVITYDNNQEIIPTLQNMPPDECKIWFKYSVNGGSSQTLREDTPKFLMDYDGDGVFSKSMIPQEYFGLEEGDELTKMDVFITTGNINAPPFTAAISLFPGCE